MANIRDLFPELGGGAADPGGSVAGSAPFTAAPPSEVPTPSGEPTVDTLLAALPFAYVSGAAGTGKTTLARQLRDQLGDQVLFCATTGIAAINLGDAVTINSALGYFDTDSLLDRYASGGLQYRLRMLRKSGVRILLLDEASMLSAAQLGIICQAIDEVNLTKVYDSALEQVTYDERADAMKLVLVGDFGQLPPVEGEFAFESGEWARFTELRLTTIRRQGDTAFIQALQAVRKGDGRTAVPVLESRFVQSLDFDFAGTTIVAKNDAVDRINNVRHGKLQGPLYRWPTLRSGEQEKDWIQKIPNSLDVKKGALVMILANKPYPKVDDDPLVGGYYYVNGDLATVVEQEPNGIRVFLHRTFEEVVVTPYTKEKKQATGKKNPKWEIKGTVSYMPLRLAWASTVHKTQGLSLDNVQVSIIDGFFSSPSMMYVALSRARTLEGLRVVGNPKMFVGRCGVDKRVGRFL